MTVLRKLLATALALLPVPALADVTARYAVETQTLLVEVDDGGNARIGMDGKAGIIHRDGVDYLFVVDRSGKTRVTELAELATTIAAVMASAKRKIDLPGAESMRFVLTAKGAATVAGRPGALWSFGPAPKPGTDAATQRQLEIVMSADPALAPVGNVFRRIAETSLPLFGLAFPEATGFAAGAAQLIAKGTPLRIMEKIEFQSADSAEIDPRRFELPAPVLSAIDFLEAASSEGGLGELPALP